ncbi:TBC14-like protein, partial [Mya arenaria]
RNSKKARELWWHGIPTNVRGKVWKLAIGNDLNITPELYEICVSRAADKIKQMDETPVIFGSPTCESQSSPEPASSQESSVELIKLDVSRTFPQLCIFQKIHFKKHNLTPDIYLYDWIFTLFSKSFPLEVACRVWDVFCRDGEEFLFRTALGILKSHEEVLLEMDFGHLAEFLTRLPDKDLYEQRLFRSIESIQMSIDKKKFSQVLSMKKEQMEPP